MAAAGGGVAGGGIDVRWIERYYLMATPLFFLVDLLFHAPVRIAAIESPGWRYAYYGALVALGVVCRWRPRLAPAAGVLESSVNILLLILAVMLPIFNLGESFAAGDDPGLAFTGTSGLTVWNFLLSGTVLLLSFRRSQGALLRDLPGPGRGRT